MMCLKFHCTSDHLVLVIIITTTIILISNFCSVDAVVTITVATRFNHILLFTTNIFIIRNMAMKSISSLLINVIGHVAFVFVFHLRLIALFITVSVFAL